MVNSGRWSIDKKKWVVFILLNLGLVPIVLVNARSVYSGDYMPFFCASAVLLLLSVFLSWRAGWRLGWSNNSTGGGSNGKDTSGLLDFLRFFLLRYFVGEALRSLYGLYIFVLFAVTLMAWLPDGFENGNVPFIFASVFYFLASVFFTAWVYGPPEKRDSDVEVLVFPLSIPNWRPEGLDLDRNQDLCEELCHNGDTKNIVVPLLAHLARYPTINTLVFLVTDRVYENGNKNNGFPGLKEMEGRQYIRAIGRVIEYCSPMWGVRKYPYFHWKDLEETEIVLRVPDGERNVLSVHFVRIGKFNNLHGIKRRINRAFSEVENRDSSKVLFDITGGTAVMSAAIILEAIKGDYRAGYVALPQGAVDVEEVGNRVKEEGIKLPGELVGKCPIAAMVEEIPISVFSFEDLTKELQKYFERAYGGR